MIIGIGCDIIEIARVAALIERRHKVGYLTEKESFIFERLKEDKRKAEWAAGRFVAKEAIYKAIHKVYPCVISNIEILSDEEGAPYCKIPSYDIQISIAHEVEYAIAYAIVSKE